MAATCKSVGSTMAQLLTAASQGNEQYTGMAARSTAVALQDFTDAVRGVAATSDDQQVHHNIIDGTKNVVHQAIVMVRESIYAVTNPQDTANQQRLAQVARDVSQALNKCVGCLPGQKDIDDAIQQVHQVSLVCSSFPPSTSVRLHVVVFYAFLFFTPTIDFGQ